MNLDNCFILFSSVQTIKIVNKFKPKIHTVMLNSINKRRTAQRIEDNLQQHIVKRGSCILLYPHITPSFLCLCRYFKYEKNLDNSSEQAHPLTDKCTVCIN